MCPWMQCPLSTWLEMDCLDNVCMRNHSYFHIQELREDCRYTTDSFKLTKSNLTTHITSKWKRALASPARHPSVSEELSFDHSCMLATERSYGLRNCVSPRWSIFVPFMDPLLLMHSFAREYIHDMHYGGVVVIEHGIEFSLFYIISKTGFPPSWKTLYISYVCITAPLISYKIAVSLKLKNKHNYLRTVNCRSSLKTEDLWIK